MVKITVNGKTFDVSQEKNLLHTCLELGFDIPYFCFHPAMGSVGACRQCAVKKYAKADDKRGKIVMSCMEPVVDGLIISTEDPEVKVFRKMVIEGLMENHPHDCPICDEGGECHLQDMTVLTGHAYRRFNFRKRTYVNQYLGPFVQHEMNRCIQCYRCVRFYKDYAGGLDFDVFGSSDRIYFGRKTDGVLESEFSGNLVEVCPTGVFTDKTFKNHYTRKWDLTNSPSVCVHCSVGCSTMAGERYGMVRRITSRYNEEVNGHFLCDRGRYGYEFLNTDERISKILIRPSKNEAPAEAGYETLEQALSGILSNGRIAGVGSPRASLESNFALETLVGKENFYSGISGQEYETVKSALNIYLNNPSDIASLKDIRESDAILILSEDITNTAPLMALAVRQGSRNLSFDIAESHKVPKWNDYPVRELAQDARSPVYIASPFSTKLDDIAAGTYRGTPDEIALLGFLTAAMIDTSFTVPGNAGKKQSELAADIGSALVSARRPVIITGTSCNNGGLLQAAGNIMLALKASGRKPMISIAFPENNTAGLGLMNARPLDKLEDNSEIDTLIILENDLYRRMEDPDALFGKTRKIIVIDHLMTPTAEKADIILPAGPFSESTGTLVNYECRAQRFYRLLPEHMFIKDSWKHISAMTKISGKAGWESIEDVMAALSAEHPIFSGISEGIKDSSFRIINQKIARSTHRFSGRTAIEANIMISEPKPPSDPDSPMSYTMEGYHGLAPADLTTYYWSPGWNSWNSLTRFSEEKLFRGEKGSFGIRLFLDKEARVTEPSSDFPPVSGSDEDDMLVVPARRIFGSEELSSRSRSVADLIPGPFILMNSRYAGKFMDKNGQFTLNYKSFRQTIDVRTDDSMPDGIGALFLKDGGRIEMPFRMKPEMKKY
jgi:NADH-quinone oxidoreductase subunit G